MYFLIKLANFYQLLYQIFNQLPYSPDKTPLMDLSTSNEASSWRPHSEQTGRLR